MEENKLTDEEIVKTFEHCHIRDLECKNCPANTKGDCVCLEDVFDLIVRVRRENAELKKQVDELEATNGQAMAYINGLEHELKQASKDTAKEILTKISAEACEHAYLNRDCEWFDRVCKEYGVEVKG